MSSKKYIERKDFINGGIITVIVAMLASLIAFVGVHIKVFDPLSKAFENTYLSDGLFYAHGRSGVDSELVIVDLDGCSSRAEIAATINDINSCSPKSLAVDVIFGKASSVSPREDSLLVDALADSPNLILAQRIAGKGVERSFFADVLECTEGDVTLGNGIVRCIPAAWEMDGERIPSFISRISAMMGRRSVEDNELVNYSLETLPAVPAKAVIQSQDYIKGKMILLGDMGDLRDLHDTPVVFDGEARTSGLNIIALSLNTLRPGNGFRNAPMWIEIFLGIILTYLFCSLVVSPFRRLGIDDVWVVGVQVVALIVLLSLSYFLFWVFHLNVSLCYWFIGIGLADLGTKFFYSWRNFLGAIRLPLSKIRDVLSKTK